VTETTPEHDHPDVSYDATDGFPMSWDSTPSAPLGGFPLIGRQGSPELTGVFP
jgi:hypothetical protein